jgi:AraC family transcriptional regulator, regulatory protein of adaptative response / methylated-DNA-[protein]-cysteine methyltransferase
MSRIRRRERNIVSKVQSMEELNEVRWKAVESRDAALVGLFVYAVRTTNVYCRPGCGARRPLRANVEFFSTNADAVTAGYRACERCHPNDARSVEPSIEAVLATCREIERARGDVDVMALARQLGYSEGHLRRRFRAMVGVSLASYARECRSSRVRETLRSGASVTDAAFDAGYRSVSAFYEHAAPRLGMTPTRYRGGASGELIRFTSVETPIGVVVAASTDRGVCSIRIGRDEEVLTQGLFNEFPHAIVERDDDGLRDVALVLVGAVRGDADACSLPLDLAGTAFQIRVWEALRTIPVGETRTYSYVANQIGSPRAVRAVASACAANNVALAIPCHRVIRRDGSLGGYRWGLPAKEAILLAERSHSDVVHAS